MRFILKGSPIAWARAIHNCRAKCYFNPQKSEQEAAKWTIKTQMITRNIKPYTDTPLWLNVTFCLPIPKTKPKEHNQYHFHRPDLSNLTKFIEDVMTGLVYHDDCLISATTAQKVYHPKPKTIINIKPAPPIAMPFEYDDLYSRKVTYR